MENHPSSMENRPEGSEEVLRSGPLECYHPRSHDMASLLIALAFTLLSVFLTILGPSGNSALESALGRLLFGAISVWGGSISIRWLLRLRNRQPRLTITSEGIVDRTSLGSPVRIPWEEIKSMEETSKGTLEIEVKDPKILGLSLQRRFLARFLRRNPRADVVIPVRLLSVPTMDIVNRAIGIHEARLLNEVRGGGTLPPTS